MIYDADYLNLHGGLDIGHKHSYSVCLVGHVSWDVLRLAGRDDNTMLGGVVYYAGRVFERLGLDIAIITKAAKRDLPEIFEQLRGETVTLRCRGGERTTVFENTYLGTDLSIRRQKVRSIADAFEVPDLAGIKARTFHLGPLTRGEMSLDFLKAVSDRCERLFLDVQGLLREVKNQSVRLVDWPDKRNGLAYVDVLKANREEAVILSGEEDPEHAARKISALGPGEVVITLGGEGTLILANGRLHRISPIAPSAVVDPTGVGDTYSAGYIYYRLGSEDVEAAGRFAAELASRKLEDCGAYAGSAHEVRALLHRFERT